MKIICDVYKSESKENYYLYVKAEEGLDRVPAELITQFGEMEKTLSFILTEDRQLGKEDPRIVMENLQANGYHLQLPLAEDRFHG